ncbi:hypothetical protein PtrSN002B_004803 [Pyrenophora tritici-repentis]|uniref:Uncharacterized protein n=1 Tax=Pyrenophora tritici-repentis TaxID=45151 RepID=A0A2W1GRK8_9PLEO|nr:hypothetical protein PtrV1_03142 [Pyrenophora tritici-repentis]KAF7442505.1 hypothetical protein A1F99_133740 [Pyrenophora tritici-repentis]KAF7579119.1 hypothetical protein PtrM4_033590 [Pyrenophora tritici-repentis]KAG9378048.1 hypothetical protein A1F94_011164 [Pyrenophora tritici-repentis]KAI0578862.1 hypothetical protein Alg215_06113 [Pyrenophora tritici-repentis]
MNTEWRVEEENSDKEDTDSDMGAASSDEGKDFSSIIFEERMKHIKDDFEVFAQRLRDEHERLQESSKALLE